MKIFETSYKDIQAVACQTSQMCALFLPDYGAKLVSLKCLMNGRELLEQAVGDRYKRPCYGGEYTAAECSAFDDMFPTIDAFISSEYPWKGVEYPDHGEVYALRWNYEIEEDSLHMWTFSVRFGYRLDKWITGKDEEITVKYQAKNLTDFPFPYIYAAHCMLAADEGMTLELPYEKDAGIVTIFSESGALGKYGTRLHWPVCGQGKFFEVPSRSVGDNFKFFFEDKAPGGECICHYADGSRLSFQFAHTEMPYLAVWMNAGGFHNMYNIALEPCTGAFDRPDIAALHQAGSVLQAQEKKEWTISFACL